MGTLQWILSIAAAVIIVIVGFNVLATVALIGLALSVISGAVFAVYFLATLIKEYIENK